MKFLRFWGRSLLWMFIFGVAAGIFGVAYSIARIANFYIQDGTPNREVAPIRVIPSETKPLFQSSISDLRNIEDVTSVRPYFIPEGTVQGSVSYFGINQSAPVKVQGVPTDVGVKSVAGAYIEEWNDISSERIPILIPRRAIELYNNVAPAQGWPTLPQDTFLGLPGLSVMIGETQFGVIPVGFDNNEIGLTISAPAEKLYEIYNELGLNPQYTYIDLELIPGLNTEALSRIRQAISVQGYNIEKDVDENLQTRILQRIRGGFMMIGLTLFLGVLILKVLFSIQYYQSFKEKQNLLELWGIRNLLIPSHILGAIIFSICTAILAWGLCFFWIIPIQQPLSQNLTSFGLKLPPLELSAESAIQIGLFAGIIYLISDLFNLLWFSFITLRKKKPL
ncbi:MAG: hypothetical protein ACRC9L_09765 [Brevinema sp.]